MKLLSTCTDLKCFKDSIEGCTLGFVPTMGALHEGHLSLVKLAKDQSQRVIVSIFVNPTQFNDKNDLNNYPRTLDKDLAMLESVGVDAVFAPSISEIYPQEDTRIFDFGNIDRVMEGATRPGHFNGVAQVVSRLFELVEPTKAFFGEKDFQQIAVIKAMCEQLKINTQIIECPIIRDNRGLALSSRNALLEPQYYDIAPTIYAALQKAAELQQTLSPEQVEAEVTKIINDTKLLELIYFNIVDSKTLEKISSWSDSEKPHGCIAVQAGNIRLIDNISFICK